MWHGCGSIVNMGNFNETLRLGNKCGDQALVMGNVTGHPCKVTFPKYRNTISGHLGFSYSIPSSSTNHDEHFRPEMENRHGIRTNIQCTSTFQQPLTSIQANKKETNQNIFEHQSSCQHNFVNTQPFSSTQSSLKPAKWDLANAYHSFGKG